MKSAVLLLGFCVASVADAVPEMISVESPSGQLKAVIRVNQGKVTYSLDFNQNTVIDNALMGIRIDDVDYSRSHMETANVTTNIVDEHYPILGVKSKARNHYASTAIQLKAEESGRPWTLQVRIYDDGFAFRYQIPGNGSRAVQGEATSFVFPERSKTWYFERNNQYKLKSYAGEWVSAPIEQMPTVSKMGPVQGFPLVIELPEGGYVLLTEAACWNYSGLRPKATGNNTFTASLADESFDLQDEIVTPWRVILCAEDLDSLVNSTLVYNLAPEPDPELYSDTDYIKPGRSVWRWWSSGTGSPEEEKQYIDHAVNLGFEYTTIDEGWEEWPDASESMEELCLYAAERKVGVFAWKRSGEISNPSGNWEIMRTFFDRLKAMGVVGLKIDFMNSESRATIDFEIAALRFAAQRNLMINFHGCHKSTGEARTFPNEVTREGIRGLELNKMKEGPIPAWHNAALPFTRFVVGNADYTPFTVNPEMLGPTTISHQLATVVCFTSVLQTLAENPEKLLQPEFEGLVTVLKQIPTVWDETKVLSGSKIGDLAVMARRRGDDWFIAAMNGAGSRDYRADLSFLGDARYHGTLITDHPDSQDQFIVEKREVHRESLFDLKMTEGGGFVLHLKSLE